MRKSIFFLRTFWNFLDKHKMGGPLLVVKSGPKWSPLSDKIQLNTNISENHK
jgi:hypothetical protein